MSVKKYTDATGVAEIWAKVKSIIPSKTSDLTNDSSFITPSGILDMFYPVGSYYETSDITFNPNVAWGGTWSLETAGQVHVSAGTGYAVSGALTNTSDGGESTHKLTENELPKVHGHAQFRAYRTSSSGTKAALIFSPTGAFSTEETTSTGHGIQVTSASGLGTYFLKINFGNDAPHENMQPYIVVNRWHRTA